MMYPNSRRRVRGKGRGAFTLLEILLVVGLLALLAAFAIPALSGQSEKAKLKMAEAAIGPNGPLATAIDLYHFDMGSYPEELKYLIEKPSDDELADKWTTRYLKDRKGLKDPWGNEYGYEPEGKHNEDSYDLWSNGKDGREGTEDDITNWEDDR